MADPIISVSALTVVYGNHRVLDGVNLDIRRGEIMVLLGGSGSGKSTMLATSLDWSGRLPGRFGCGGSILMPVRRNN